MREKERDQGTSFSHKIEPKQIFDCVLKQFVFLPFWAIEAFTTTVNSNFTQPVGGDNDNKKISTRLAQLGQMAIRIQWSQEKGKDANKTTIYLPAAIPPVTARVAIAMVALVVLVLIGGRCCRIDNRGRGAAWWWCRHVATVVHQRIFHCASSCSNCSGSSTAPV